MLDQQATESPPPVTARQALTSSASADWGTPEVIRRLAAVVLKPTAKNQRGSAVDVDGSTSAYWNAQWTPEHRPVFILDGTPGLDATSREDWLTIAAHFPSKRIGGVFKNPPGDPSGGSVQDHFTVLESLWREQIVESVFWVGFSLEQCRSLIPDDEQIKSGDDIRHPLHADACSIFPSRRVSYMAHPDAMIAIIDKRLAKRGDDSEAARLRKRRTELVNRADDSPVAGPAPTHSSYLTILWSHNASVRRRQQHAMREFLRAQKTVPGSVLKRAVVIGNVG